MKERIRYCVKKTENDTGTYFKDYNIAYDFCIEIKGLLFETNDNGETLRIDMRGGKMTFEVLNYDINGLYMCMINNKKGIYINDKVVYVAGRQNCDIDECVFDKQSFILIADNKEMIIQTINKPFLKEILKFVINNNIIDYKIINK